MLGWTIVVPVGERVQLTSEGATLDDNAIWADIYDGPNEKSALLVSVSDNVLPSPVLSSGDILTVVLYKASRGGVTATATGVPGRTRLFTTAVGQETVDISSPGFPGEGPQLCDVFFYHYTN